MSQPNFSVYLLERETDFRIEDENGRFDKYWNDDPILGRCLFKAACPFDADLDLKRLDWREKTACELGKLLELPVAETELATTNILQVDVKIPGTISINYISANSQAISLREFLGQVDINYDNIYADSYEDGYSVENVIQQLKLRAVGLPRNWQGIDGIDDAADLLIGYLMFDRWLGGTDRHDENIEIIDRIPDDRITPISAKFAKNLLAHNQAQILSLQLSTQSQLKQVSNPNLIQENSESDDLSLDS